MLKEGQPSAAEERNKQLKVLSTYAAPATGIGVAAVVFFIARGRFGNTKAAIAAVVSGLVGAWVFSQFEA